MKVIYTKRFKAGIAQLVERNLAKTMFYKKNPLDTVQSTISHSFTKPIVLLLLYFLCDLYVTCD